jgi:hypothetical protein
MKHVKTTFVMAASLILTVLFALAGCGEDHGDRFRSERDRRPEQIERHDSDRHDERGAEPARERGER